MNYLFDKVASNAADRIVTSAANMMQPNYSQMLHPMSLQPMEFQQQFQPQQQQQLPQHSKTNVEKIINNNKDDAISIDSFAKNNSTTSNTISPTNIKLVFILFLLFIFIVSDVFTGTILSCFGHRAVKGRSPTAVGIIIQGIFLIIFYILFATLIKKGVI